METAREWWAVTECPSLANVINECLIAKRNANRRDCYVRELRRFFGKFSEGRENRSIASIGPAEIELFFKQQGFSRHTQATAINRLSTLFAFATRRGYIVHNPLDRLERITIERKPPRIFSPTEARQMLAIARVKEVALLGYLVLGLFAGIRPAEIDRLEWCDVDQVRKLIRIDAAASKIRRRRIVPICETLAAWLGVVANRSGRISPNQKQRRLQRLAVRMGAETWDRNILRHSCSSYLLALHQDSGKIAHWLGNSPGVLLRHYHELVSPEDATAFWSIRP